MKTLKEKEVIHSLPMRQRNLGPTHIIAADFYQDGVSWNLYHGST